MVKATLTEYRVCKRKVKLQLCKKYFVQRNSTESPFSRLVLEKPHRLDCKEAELLGRGLLHQLPWSPGIQVALRAVEHMVEDRVLGTVLLAFLLALVHCIQVKAG